MRPPRIGSRAAIAAVFAALVCVAPAKAASVSVRRTGDVYHVSGDFSAQAAPEAAWGVLTDYDHLPLFVSSLRASKAIGRSAEGLIVEQEGGGSFLFLSRKFKIRLLVRESPPDRLDFSEEGDEPFLLYKGHWTIERRGDSGCVVAYELDIAPGKFAGPALFAGQAIRRNIIRQLDEVRLEILRRSLSP